jgi:hypothetical protein
LLEKDEKEKVLTYNERNCVLFRSGEKKILNFLINSAEKILHLSGVSQKEAKKQMNNMKDFDACSDYFKSVFLPILPNN